MAKDIETINKDQSEINNTLEGINSRLDEAQGWISDLENKIGKTIKQSSKEKKIILKTWGELKKPLEQHEA